MREAVAAKEQAADVSALRQAEAELAEFAAGTPAGTNSLREPVRSKPPSMAACCMSLKKTATVVAAGTPVMDIGDPADIEVAVEVLSRDGATIRRRARRVGTMGRRRAARAKVRLVEPAAFTKVSALGVEEQRVNVVADLLTPPDQRRSVGDNFRVEARIIVWEARDALKVPAGALFRKGEQWAAFVVADGRARLRIVKAGRSSGTETQVLEGLKEGEEVILYPGSRVRDGQRVTP